MYRNTRLSLTKPPNGVRLRSTLRVPAGGRDETRPLCRNWLGPRKLLENAQTPTSVAVATSGARCVSLPLLVYA